jgi:hypothetical protein
MPKIPFEPCIPTRGTKVPAGPDWIHEIKHDGYRLIVQRDGARVRHKSKASLFVMSATFEIDGVTEDGCLRVAMRSILSSLTSTGAIPDLVT